MRISGSTVLLTGASGGLGQAIARALHERGASLVLSGRRRELLASLAAELGARQVAADLAERDGVERLLAEAGEVDILVANAGLPGSGRLESFTVEQIDRTLEVNLRAPILLAHALAPAMAARGRGHLLFMCSLGGKVATAGASVYSASKYGLRGFARALRAELRVSGVGVSAVFPGFVREVGMFAETEVTLPPGFGTSTPADVTRAVVAAIEGDRGEVDVAPLPVRASVLVARVAPELSAILARRLGGDEIAARFADDQREKR